MTSYPRRLDSELQACCYLTDKDYLLFVADLLLGVLYKIPCPSFRLFVGDLVSASKLLHGALKNIFLKFNMEDSLKVIAKFRFSYTLTRSKSTWYHNGINRREAPYYKLPTECIIKNLFVKISNYPWWWRPAETRWIFNKYVSSALFWHFIVWGLELE